jgi:hypothetical protein
MNNFEYGDKHITIASTDQIYLLKVAPYSLLENGRVSDLDSIFRHEIPIC